MQKVSMFLVLVFSCVIQQLPAQSISARLGTNRANKVALDGKHYDLLGKAIVKGAINDLFPGLQEVLVQSEPELKALITVQIKAMSFSRLQLQELKAMTQEAQFLILEVLQGVLKVLNKRGKELLMAGKKFATAIPELEHLAPMIKGSKERVLTPKEQDVLSRLVQSEDELKEVLANGLSEHQMLQEKIMVFYDKWASSSVVAHAIEKGNLLGKTREQGIVQNEIGVKLMRNASSNQHALTLEPIVASVLVAIGSTEKNCALIAACLNELDSQLPQFVASSEKLMLFAVPFLCQLIIESADELVKTIPA